MAKILYRPNFWKNTILEQEVERETPKYWFLKAKKDDWMSERKLHKRVTVYPTWEEAHAVLLQYTNEQIVRARSDVLEAEAAHQKVLQMRPPKKPKGK